MTPQLRHSHNNSKILASLLGIGFHAPLNSGPFRRSEEWNEHCPLGKSQYKTHSYPGVFGSRLHPQLGAISKDCIALRIRQISDRDQFFTS
jgi:hypothetical protein